MSENERLAETTVSVLDIPADEREEYLAGLPPARLRWALFDAAERFSVAGPVDRFYLLQVLGWIGGYAAAKDLKAVREDAMADVKILVPVIVRILEMAGAEGAAR